MMTINLCTFNKGIIDNDIWISNDNVPNDRKLDVSKLPLCPKIVIPQIINNNTISGSSYLGNYYFYIRYKINDYDYTQWYNFGYPIMNEFEIDKTIHKKIKSNKENYDIVNNQAVGAHETYRSCEITISFNENIDLIDKCININITNIDKNYNYFQIGYICVSNT